MLTIAWDIDDVLNSLMNEWFEDFKATHSSSISHYCQLSTNPPHQLIGISKNEYLVSLDRFRDSEKFAKLHPNEKIQDWFNAYGDKFHHIALTAVPLKTAHHSAQWLMKHFGKWIRTFHFIPSKRDEEIIPQYDISKGAYLERVRSCDILIEDNEQNYNDAKGLNIDAYLVDRPWNSSTQSIDDILEKLNEKIEE